MVNDGEPASVDTVHLSALVKDIHHCTAKLCLVHVNDVDKLRVGENGIGRGIVAVDDKVFLQLAHVHYHLPRAAGSVGGCCQ